MSERSTETTGSTLYAGVTDWECAPDMSNACVCRKAHFEQHVVEWMADPKGSEALVECWINHWTQVDEGLGGRLKAELAGRKVGHVFTDSM